MDSSSSSKGGIKIVIRAVIMAILVVLFAGEIFIWVITPTSLFKNNWLLKIRAKANTTYFGAQGATTLIYTFPVLFMAILGCVYNHLRMNISKVRTKSQDKKQRMGTWKRPMIIKGLGIVTLTEMAFLTMFVALLVWSFSTYLHVGFAKITPQSLAKSGEKMWEAKLESAALRIGLIGNICLAFLFFPVTRGSSVLPLFGLTSEGSIKYHIWLGHIVMTLFTAHGASYITYWALTHQLSEMLKWGKTGVANVAGEIALVFGLAMWITAIPRTRRKMFEVFYYTHHLYALFLLFFLFHVGIAYASMMLPGLYLFLVDRYLRFLQSRQTVRLVSARVLPCQAVELNFSKCPSLKYTATSIMFLNVPSISKMQWHPFTVTSNSNSEEEKISVVIKGEGSWSKKLHHMLSSSPSIDRLGASIEGPYGPLSTHFLRHDRLVMVSGGSGITPFISIIRELIYTTDTLKSKTPKVLLITAFKNSSDLTMLDLLLPITTTTIEASNLNIQIEAYITREKQWPAPESHKQIQTLWFKPDALDAPLSPILGQKGWLWLGAIISSSFVTFLVLMAILTRYYIFPIDHNTNKIFSSASRSVLNILLISISIAVASSAAFLWNKKQNVMETKQIQNAEGTTPVASPNSWFYNADRGLESFPQQALVQSTNVHFGERPNLKKILFELKETSVGVFVCGPKKMRHEVAGICSSGLADNLRFESISFSW